MNWLQKLNHAGWLPGWGYTFGLAVNGQKIPDELHSMVDKKLSTEFFMHKLAIAPLYWRPGGGKASRTLPTHEVYG